MFKPYATIDEKLTHMTHSKGWKVWREWKYLFLSGLLVLGTFSYHGLSALADDAPATSTWTEAKFLAWYNASDENKQTYEDYKNSLNCYIVPEGETEKQFGTLLVDLNGNGRYDEGEAYIDTSDFDTLLKIALTPYTPN